MERIRLINQPLKAVTLVRPKLKKRVAVQYAPAIDKYVRVMDDHKLYWKPF